MFSKNFLIGQRLALGFSVSLIALMAIGFFSLRNLDEMQRETGWVNHTMEVMAELRLLNDSASRIESSGRGYLLSGEASLKAELASQRLSAATLFGKLHTLTGDNPAQQSRLDQLEALVARRVEV